MYNFKNNRIMPSGNHTGPTGQGPGTGRSRGFCSGFKAPGDESGLNRNRGSAIGISQGIGRNRKTGTGSRAAIGQGYSADRLLNFGLLISELIQNIPWKEILHKRDEIETLRAEAKRLRRSNAELEEKLRESERPKE